MSGLSADRCKVLPGLWRGLEALGLSRVAVLRRARLPAGASFDDENLTTAQYFALWHAVEELAGISDLGVKLVEGAKIAAYPPSSLAAFHARDYRDALERTARFKRLCSPERLTLAETSEECMVNAEWLYASEPSPALVTDVTFASLVMLGRKGTGTRITPRRVEFARRGPKNEKLRAWFDCPIRYAAGRDALVLKSSDLARPFPGHNPELLNILTPALSSALETLRALESADAPLAARVKAALTRRLAGGRPEIADVARELFLSERTLQRRITEEGTTFRALLEDARRETARRLLADPTIDIRETAFLLGYQDTPSFHRAFRDWEGLSPLRWRKTSGNNPVGSAPGRPPTPRP